MPNTSEKYKTDYYFKKKNDLSPIVFIHGVGLGHISAGAARSRNFGNFEKILRFF